MQLHQCQYLYEPSSYDTPLIHIWVVALKSAFRAYVEMDVAKSANKEIEKGDPCGPPFYLSIYMQVGG